MAKNRVAMSQGQALLDVRPAQALLGLPSKSGGMQQELDSIRGWKSPFSAARQVDLAKLRAAPLLMTC